MNIYRYKSSIMMICLMILIGGIYSYIQIPREESPLIKVPSIYITIRFSGMSAEDMNRMIISPIETRIRSVHCIESIESQSLIGMGFVIAKFKDGTNMNRAKLDIREQIEQAKSSMPTGVEQIRIDEVDLSRMSTMRVILRGDLSDLTLLRNAKKAKSIIESINGIAEARILNEKRRIADVVIQPKKWFANGFGAELFPIIELSNKIVALGSIVSDNRQMPITMSGVLSTKQDILNVPIRFGPNAMQLKDIGEVEDDVQKSNHITMVNGKRAIIIEVALQSGSNAIQVIKNVRDQLPMISHAIDKDVEVIFSRDITKTMGSRLNELLNSVIFASILVVIVVLTQIGARYGIVVGMSIPMSFFASIMTIYAMGYTINIVVLFSLIMAVGMIVDASIIVVEYADQKIRSGVDAFTSYVEAVKTMIIPVISATFGIAVVYVPLLMWPGTAGQFIRFMPITIIIVLSWSIISAMIFIPVIGSFVCRKYVPKESKHYMIRFADLYAKWLAIIIARPIRTIIVCISFSVMLIVMSIFLMKGTVFFPNIEPDFAIIKVKAVGNLSLNQKVQIAKIIESRIKVVAENDIDLIYNVIGTADAMIDNTDIISTIDITFKDWSKRRDAKTIIQDINIATSDIPNVIIEIQKDRKGPNASKPISVIIKSNNRKKLTNVANTIYERMLINPLLKDVNDSRARKKIESSMTIDKANAAKYGINLASISQVIRLMTDGMMLGFYYPNDSNDRLQIFARFPESYNNMKNLSSMPIATPSGQMIGLDKLVKFTKTTHNPRIDKIDGLRVIKLDADVVGNDINGGIKSIESWILSQDFDKDVTITFGGDSGEQKKTIQFLIVAFIIAFLVKILILVIQFNSIYYTVVTMSAVLLSVVGVFVGLVILQKPFVIMMSGVGIVSLAGIVVSNNIILIDTYIRLIDSGMEQIEAIITAARQRLRPILITSMTTIIGLLPMACNISIDFLSMKIYTGSPSGQWWEALSTVIASGLISATLLTLILTPCFLALPNIKRRLSIS